MYTYFGLTIFLTGVNVGFMPLGKLLGETLGGRSYSWILIPLAAVMGALEGAEINQAKRVLAFEVTKLVHGEDEAQKAQDAAEAVRDAVGPDAALCFDWHGRYDSSLAIRIGRELERFDLLFFEEPVQPEDEEGMVRVAASQPVPVAAGVVGDAAQLLVQIEVLGKQNCFSAFFMV